MKFNATTMINSHIQSYKEERNKLRSDESECCAYFDGAIDALEALKESIGNLETINES